MAKKYSDAEDYPERAKEALKEMHRQVGDLVMNEMGVAFKGLLVRHLVMPEDIAGTEEVVKFLADEISTETYLNVMDQYHPCYKAFEYPELTRRITKREYQDAIDHALKAGIKRLDGVTT
jgi:putative pyruvate formate lyase activating enzyme